MSRPRKRGSRRPAVRSTTRRREWPRIVAAVGIPLVLTAGVVAAIAAGSGGGGNNSSTSTSSTSTTLKPRLAAEQKRTQDYQSQIDGDFSPLTNDLIQLLQQAQNWRDGKTSGSDVTALVDHDLPDFFASKDKLAGQAPYPPAPATIVDYRTALDLYIEAIRVLRVAATLPAGPLQTQVDTSFRRLRELADRTYDQGRADLKPLLHAAPPSPDVETRLPADVPNWVAEGLSAGPPLEAPPPPAAATPPQYQQNRPQQSQADWTRAVQAAGVPPVGQLAAAVTAGDASTLQRLADEYAGSTTRLDATGDPKDDRALSTRVRLGLLVDGESARVAQALTLVTDSTQSARLQAVARRLALIGDTLWSPSLGARHSGFDPGLLSQTGP